MSDKVSILINCYNGEKFLKECLSSVENQSYQNYEVIFWDNKSIDRSKNIFNSFQNNKFKYYLSDKFTNLSEARNKAINLASGDYITFLDVDDIWLKDKLKKQVSFMKNNNLHTSFTNYYIKQENITKKNLKKYKILNRKYSGEADFLEESMKNFKYGKSPRFSRHAIKNLENILKQKLVNI